MTFTWSRPLRMFSRPPQMLKQVIAGRSWELNSWEASVRPSVARNKGGIYIQRRILSSSFLPRVWAPQIVFKSKTPRGPSFQWKLPRGLLERESRAQAGVCTPPRPRELRESLPLHAWPSDGPHFTWRIESSSRTWGKPPRFPSGWAVSFSVHIT